MVFGENKWRNIPKRSIAVVDSRIKQHDKSDFKNQFTRLHFNISFQQKYKVATWKEVPRELSNIQGVEQNRAAWFNSFPIEFRLKLYFLMVCKDHLNKI